MQGKGHRAQVTAEADSFPASEIVIAGKKFHAITQELPAAQDHYLMGHLRLAGCLEHIASQESPEQRAEALLTKLLISGRTNYVLAGALTEVGQKWTVESADRNAKLFDEARDAESKAEMRNSILGLVLGFFQFATASVATFQKSSSPN